MSALITRLNRVKVACGFDWLTPSQSRAWHELHDRLVLGEVVNLHGPSGCGKTFLVWVLAKLKNVIYVPSFTSDSNLQVASLSALLVIDSYHSTREAYRELLKSLSRQGYVQALVLTRAPIRDDCFRVSLTLTETDLDHARQRILTIDPLLPPRRGGTLHHIINPDLPLHEEMP